MRVLFLTARFPYPPLKGDKIVSYQRLKHLSRSHEITLLSFCDGTLTSRDLAEVGKFCRDVHTVPLRKTEMYSNLLRGGLGNTPFQVLYHQSRAFQRRLGELLTDGTFDLLHVFMLRIAPYVADYAGCPKLLELIDSMELNMERRASFERGIGRMLFQEETRRLVGYERRLAERFDRAVVVSDVDAQVIGARNLEVSPLGIDFQQFYPQRVADGADPLIVFTGNMAYFPNENAVLYFANDVFPRIQRRMPEARFRVVGGGPSPRLRRLEDANKAIRVVGFVDSMCEHINRAAVSVCPMLAGSGMQFKILEALACGVPVVATSVAKGDIRISEEEGLLIADDPVTFADKVVGIIENGRQEKNAALRAREILKRRYSWPQCNAVIDRIYAELSNRKIRSHHEEGTHHRNYGTGRQLPCGVSA
jgi:sugar transferase (PEP-CTERM/EpsH1 system associated)